MAELSHNKHWYVIQTMSGQEFQVVEYLTKMIDPELVLETFVPQRRLKKCYHGVWRVVQEKVIPGYVFVVTPDPDVLVGKLYAIPAFTRMLRAGESFVPLLEQEVAFVNAFSTEGHRIIDMSEGIIEGDQIIVLNGPLMGQEAIIRKIDRHKRAAFVEMSVMGRTKLVKVGLEILHKR